MLKFFSLKSKLIFLFLIISILPLCIISYFTVYNSIYIGQILIEKTQQLTEFSTSTSSKALEEQAKESLRKILFYETKRTNQFLSKIDNDITYAGEYVINLVDNRNNYKYRWSPEKYGYDKRGTLIKNNYTHKIDESQILVNSKIKLTDEIKEYISLTEHLDPIYRNIKKLNLYVERIFVNFENGLESIYPWVDTDLYPNRPLDSRQRDFYQLALPVNNEDKKVVWTNPYVDELGKGWMVTCSLPLYNREDKFIGVQSIDITLKSLIDNIISINIGKTGYGFMLDKNGYTVAVPEKAKMDFNLYDFDDKASFNLKESSNLELRKSIERMLLNNSNVIETITLNGSKKYIAYSNIESTDWHIGIVVPIEEIIGPATKIFNELSNYSVDIFKSIKRNIAVIITRVLLVIIFTAITAAVIGILLSSRIIRSIRNLIKGTEVVAAGNLTYKIELFSNDEVGQLANSFNIMAKKLKQSYVNLEDEIKVVKQSNLKLDILQQLTRVLSTELNVKNIFNKIIESCATLVNAEMGYFIILDETKNFYEIVAAFGESTEFIGDTRGKSEHPIVNETLRLRKSVYISNIDDYSEYKKEHILLLDAREIICAPLYIDNEPVGVIQIFNSKKTVNKLKEEDVLLLELFIPHAEIAIKNSRTYKKIEDSRRYTSNLIKNIPNPMAVLDNNGNIVEVNDMVEFFFNTYQESVISAGFYKFFDDEYRDKINGAINEAIEKNFSSCEVNIIKDNGVYLPVILNFSPLKDQFGDIINILVTATDISELRRREKELAKLNTELNRANKAKSMFMANMSHELRTPLNAIIGFSEVMKEGLVGDMNKQQLEYIKDIYENGRHLLSLINNILNLTKIDVNKMECDLELVDVREILKGSIKVITIKANEKNIELSVSISESINEIEVDIRKFKQILFNLLSNAVKFTPKGGKIILQAEKVSLENVLKNKNKYGFAKYPRVFTKYKEYLSVSVIDTGIGITREDQKKLFIPFVQINSGLSKEYEGTGLGLALVKELVELHNGTIVVESELKKGSNFTFFIPYRNSK